MKTKDELLEEANQIIRSFNSIIERLGEDTNWEALSTTVKRILKEQHEVLHPKKQTLEKYIKDNLQSHGEHRLRSSIGPNGEVEFYIHPYGFNGQTCDFIVLGNVLTSKNG